MRLSDPGTLVPTPRLSRRIGSWINPYRMPPYLLDSAVTAPDAGRVLFTITGSSHMPKVNRDAADALAQVTKIACRAGFGRFDPKTNALDDKIESAASDLADLLARCLPKREARRILDVATAQGIYEDARRGGISPKEARQLADPQHRFL